MSVLVTNETIKEVFHIAESVARENYNSEYGASHLLQALLHNNFGLKDFLLNIEKDPGYIYEWAEVRIEELPKTAHLPDDISKDEKVNIILEEADDIRLKLGLDEVSPLCLLAAISKPNVAYNVQELKSFPLREHEILNFFRGEDKKVSIQENHLTGNSIPNKNSFPAINSYCSDKTQQANQGKFLYFWKCYRLRKCRF
ncbi:hypothetical protein [Epilithonimonas sp.]|uniref:hypothetical protein n=1 Tax=Epilithonimonas sp. TaxID=2894511 RepID=UPI002FDD236C